MSTAASLASPYHRLRRSRIHGTGVFAARAIAANTRIMPYQGERISSEEADRRHPANPEDPYHTFFFALADGRVIDGGRRGNDARWINHSCAPNCEAQQIGRSIYIVALTDIRRGEELYYDYGLVIDARKTASLKAAYRCLCGAPECRGTLLAA